MGGIDALVNDFWISSVLNQLRLTLWLVNCAWIIAFDYQMFWAKFISKKLNIYEVKNQSVMYCIFSAFVCLALVYE